MGTQALVIGGSSLAVLLVGGLGGTPMATIAYATAWLAILDLGGFRGDKSEAHLFVELQGQGRDECLMTWADLS